MNPFALEHSKLGYWADFIAYALAISGLAAILVAEASRARWLVLAALVLAGLAAWSLIEYAMHRFVLHGLEPFRSWHASHHDRPHALISAPTLLSASLITGLVFLPAFLLLGAWAAGALTLGVTIGYLAYALTHHATHHWAADNGWLRARKRWHARHHHLGNGCFGVSSSFWDRVFRSKGPRATA